MFSFQRRRMMLMFLLMLSVYTQISQASSQCDRSSRLSFTVSTLRNGTGHRLVTADVRSELPEKDDITMTVDQWSEKCGATGAVVLSMTASRADSSPYPFTTMTTTAAPVRQTPRPDYTHLHGDRYYKVHSNKVSWAEAQRTCKDEGTDLWIPTNQDEIDKIYRITSCCPWIGVLRQDSSSQWMTVEGEELNTTGTIRWHTGHPTDSGDCVLISASGNGNIILNQACANKWKPVCQQNL